MRYKTFIEKRSRTISFNLCSFARENNYNTPIDRLDKFFRCSNNIVTSYGKTVWTLARTPYSMQSVMLGVSGITRTGETVRTYNFYNSVINLKFPRPPRDVKARLDTSTAKVLGTTSVFNDFTVRRLFLRNTLSKPRHDKCKIVKIVGISLKM